MRKHYIGGFYGIPKSINLPSVGAGEPIEALHINKISREIDSNKVQNVRGSLVKRTTGGTSIVPKRKFEQEFPWRVYCNTDFVSIEIGRVYGSRTKKVANEDTQVFSGGRDTGYTAPIGMDVYCDINNHWFNDHEPWTLNFPHQSTDNSWMIYARMEARPVPEPEEGEEPEWQDPNDMVAFVSIAPYTSGVEQNYNGVPIALVEAVRDLPSEEELEENPEAVGQFKFWNIIQVNKSDIGLEKYETKNHPFQVTLVGDGEVEIEQGFVYAYPNGFVDTGIGIYQNAVKLGDSIAPVTDGTENNPVNPLKPDGTPKTPEEIAIEQAQKDAVKASKYLLNSNGQTFTISEGDYVLLNFYRIDDGPVENPEEFLGWRCTVEISSIMPSNILNGQYNTSMLGACNTDYPNCGPWVQKQGTSGGEVFNYWERWKNAKHVSTGNQAYPIAKIVDGNVVQFLRSDFFFSPPLDSSISFPEYRFSAPVPETTGLTPSSGE